MRKKGDNSCVKPCEENQTKKNHPVLFEKYLIPHSGNALSTKQKPNKFIQIQTCLVKTPNNTPTPSRPSGLHPC
jgi:hypothetical protein